MGNELLISKSDFRALSSGTRTGMLKMLEERNYTLSELSVKTGMAAPTIKQHAKILMDSGLIELRDEGRKWKYYALTRRGKEILGSGKGQTNIFIVLSSSALVLLGIVFLFAGMASLQGASSFEKSSDRMLQATPETGSETLGEDAGQPATQDGSSTDAEAEAGKNGATPGEETGVTGAPPEAAGEEAAEAAPVPRVAGPGIQDIFSILGAALVAAGAVLFFYFRGKPAKAKY